MNHNTKKILLLGSGALQIGQAGEFDYSGSQAIKAFKEEGIETILINPNIATIQTSEGFADKVYFLPVTPHFVKEVIKAEKPDTIALSFGGQTALNCGLELESSGFLKKHRVQILGTPIEAVQTTEDRKLFADFLTQHNLLIPKSSAIKTLKEAKAAAAKIGFPLIARSAFSLGGQDSQVLWNSQELEQAITKALSKSPQVLLEEYLNGWKEIEYEVVRDKNDNCITVCNMENLDPMGIHTGESIVVAPSQTLNNFEYHTLRQIAIKTIRNLGIIGECNIQFALNPRPETAESANNSHLEPSTSSSEKAKGKNRRANPMTGPLHQTLDYRIIEVNARLSRSSALASKATGYPLAYVAAKLGLGCSLTDLKNSVTKKTIACFEPALDYVVVKIPRWDLNKFVKSEKLIGPQMQSVGEVMAIGRKFEEALQKAIRMLDIGMEGILDEKAPLANYSNPTPWRIFAIGSSLKKNIPVSKIYKNSGIDPFFLEKIKNIVSIENKLQSSKKIDAEDLRTAKQLGSSDRRIASLLKTSAQKIREAREKYDIKPVVKQIDTLAGEYPAQTNYLYLTYNGTSDDAASETPNPSRDKIIVLGSGPYRIGSSVEFDWCSVTCAQTIAANGIDPIIINCNPETVSTDYDMAKRLYFEELSQESVLEIYNKENPKGVIISMGGQTPNNLVMSLAKNNVNILGTSPNSIDRAEDRNKFSSLCDELEIDQPAWAKLNTVSEAAKFGKKIGYPVLVRPSYVLSGAAMNIAFDTKDLKNYLSAASHISSKYPVVISKFLENTKELEIDAISQNGQILTYAISEHIENGGVHSGDSTLVLPAQKIYLQTERQILKIAQKISQALTITGPFNIQFLAKDNKVMVIECNLRASRSLPFVSKVTGVNFVKVATSAIIGKSQKPQMVNDKEMFYVGVKAPQFSFSRVKGADPVLRVEMASTGEVACFGQDVEEAFLKSQIATGHKLPEKSVFISLAGEENKVKFLESAKLLSQTSLEIYATAKTAAFFKKHGIKTKTLHKIHEKKKPNVLDFLHAKKIDLVINIINPYFKKEFDDDYLIRRASIDFGVSLFTNLQTAELFVKAISEKTLEDLKPLPWDTYVKTQKSEEKTPIHKNGEMKISRVLKHQPFEQI